LSFLTCPEWLLNDHFLHLLHLHTVFLFPTMVLMRLFVLPLSVIEAYPLCFALRVPQTFDIMLPTLFSSSPIYPPTVFSKKVSVYCSVYLYVCVADYAIATFIAGIFSSISGNIFD
jgi:hypothetical protein